MKITSIILSVLGALAAAAIAIKWLGDAADGRETIKAMRALGADTSELDRVIKAAYCLLGTAAAGIAAIVLLVKGKGPIAAAVLAVAVAVPAVLEPKSLIATFLLVIAAAFALAVRPRGAGRAAAGARLATS